MRALSGSQPPDGFWYRGWVRYRQD